MPILRSDDEVLCPVRQVCNSPFVTRAVASSISLRLLWRPPIVTAIFLLFLIVYFHWYVIVFVFMSLYYDFMRWRVPASMIANIDEWKCIKHSTMYLRSANFLVSRRTIAPDYCPHGPLARYAKLRVRMRRECRERFPRHRGWAIPTCITARASRTCRDAFRDR